MANHICCINLLLMVDSVLDFPDLCAGFNLHSHMNLRMIERSHKTTYSVAEDPDLNICK